MPRFKLVISMLGTFVDCFLKKWAIPGLFFLYFRLFNTQLTANKCSIYK